MLRIRDLSTIKTNKMSDLNENNTPRRQPSRRSMPSVKTLLGLTFGIFMVIIYVGMGVLLMINFFNWTPAWDWARWIVGPVLVIYGFYRGWRQYKMFTQSDDEI